MPIQHEGAEYYSKDEVEGIVKGRVKTEQERYTTLEQRWTAVQPQLAEVATVKTELETWKGKASSHEGALNRYKAATSHGITDPDTLEALEQAHGKAMGRVEEGKRVDFGTFLGEVKKDPTLLPTYLRGVFTGPGAPGMPGAGAPGAGAPSAGAPGAGTPGAGTPGAGTPGAGTPGAGAPNRPAWAASNSNQVPVTPGSQQGFTDRIKGAKSLDDLVAIQNERRTANRG